jgi:hypothetical protein
VIIKKTLKHTIQHQYRRTMAELWLRIKQKLPLKGVHTTYFLCVFLAWQKQFILRVSMDVRACNGNVLVNNKCCYFYRRKKYNVTHSSLFQNIWPWRIQGQSVRGQFQSILHTQLIAWIVWTICNICPTYLWSIIFLT